jgi:hypothetical protein
MGWLFLSDIICFPKVNCEKNKSDVSKGFGHDKGESKPESIIVQ